MYKFGNFNISKLYSAFQVVLGGNVSLLWDSTLVAILDSRVLPALLLVLHACKYDVLILC